MGAPRPPMVRRVAAAEAAVRRFSGAPFKWSSNDCARLAAFTLRRLGHKPPMPRAGSYNSPRAALKALKAAGFDSLEAALDSFLPRVTPASAKPGDIMAFPSDGDHQGWTALAVYVGNGRVLAFHGDPAVGPVVGAVIGLVAQPSAVWSAL